MSVNYISKAEGLFLLNYLESSINDIQYQLESMSSYIERALIDTGSSTKNLTNRTELGNQFLYSCDLIDSISGYAIYNGSRFLPANKDYLYLNNMKYSSTIPFNRPFITDHTSLFKAETSVNSIFTNLRRKPFYKPDDSAFIYVNCNFTDNGSITTADTSAYDGTLQYYSEDAPNFITLIFPCVTVDGMFSAWMPGPGSIHNPATAINGMQQALIGEYLSRGNPFLNTSGSGDKLQNQTDPIAKINIWRSLINNNGVADYYLNPSNISNYGASANYIFQGSPSLSNTVGFERIRELKSFIADQKARINAVNVIVINSSINENLNIQNNSIPDDIRMTSVNDAKIDLVQYIPQFMREAYPDTTEFMAIFENVLNTLYTGEGNYTFDYSSSGSQETYDASGNLISTIKYKIPETQRISILEKIKRLAETQDPELIDFEFLTYLANNMGYAQSGFATNFNDAFTSLSLGYTLNDDSVKDISVDARKYLRYFISNLPSFYRIKSTKNCLKVLLYSMGLVGDMQNVFSSDYSSEWVTSKNRWDTSTSAVYEDITTVKGKYGPLVVTPHFKILLDLTKSITSISYDFETVQAMFRAIEAVRPINTVFDGLNGLFYTNNVLNILPELPITTINGHFSSATSGQSYAFNNVRITDNFINVPTSADIPGYSSYKIKDIWRNGYHTSALGGLTELPNNENVTLLESLYTNPTAYSYSWQLGSALWTTTAINQSYINYVALKSPYVATSGTIVVYPGLDKTISAEIIGKFVQMTSSTNLTTATSAGIGFNIGAFQATSASTSANSSCWLGIRKGSGNFLEIFRNNLGTGLAEVVVSSINLPLGSMIHLKVARTKLTNSMRYNFYYRTVPYNAYIPYWTEITSASFTVSTSAYPKFNGNSPYPILKCDYALSNDSANPNIGLCNLTLLA